MKGILLYALLTVFFIYSAGAKDYKVASPDKKIEVTP